MRLASTRSFPGFTRLVDSFQRLYTILEETGDELVTLDAIKFCLSQLFFIALFDLAVRCICLHSLGTLAILNIYDAATRLPFSFHKDTMDLLAMV